MHARIDRLRRRRRQQQQRRPGPVPHRRAARSWPPNGTNMLDVGGTMRTYIVAIPNNYDPNKPYKLVFAWHGLGGNAQQIAGGLFGGGYYGLQALANNTTVFVAPQGLDTGITL